MVDARGLSCPMPVLMVQKACKSKPDALEVMVDDRCAVENITRFATGQGYRVSVQEKGDEFGLTLKK